jgi:hypothetical protein
MNDKVIEYSFVIFASISIATMLWIAVENAVSLPDVWFSYATNDCVKVVNYKEGHNYSCELLPNRFNHVWVE